MDRSSTGASPRHALRRSVWLSLATVALAQGWATGATKTFDLAALTGSTVASPTPWFLGANWDPTGVPTATDDVFVGGMTTLSSAFMTQLDLGPVASGTLAEAHDLTLDGPVDLSSGFPKRLNVRAFDAAPGGFSTPMSVTGTLNAGNFPQSEVDITARHVRLTDPAALHHLGQSGGTGGLYIHGGGTAPGFTLDLDIAGRLNLGDTVGSAITPWSIGNLRLDDAATARLRGDVIVARLGGQAGFALAGGSTALADRSVVVGGGGIDIPSVGYRKSTGALTLFTGFSDPLPTRLDLEGGRLDIATNLLVDPAGVANGGVEVTRSRLVVGIPLSGPSAAIVVGRNARLEGPDPLHSQGSLAFIGRAYLNPPGGPLVELPSLEAHATAFVGVEGGHGAISSDASHLVFHRDVVVGTGSVTLTTGGSEPTDIVVPGDGLFSVGLNSRIDIRQDVFIGNNNAFGTFDAIASGDGGSLTTARYVGIGNGGTGHLNVAGMNTVRVHTVEVFNDTGPESYQLGGFVDLGPDGLLSAIHYDFNQEGGRLSWFSGTLELRGGILGDFGTNILTVPTDGVLRGAGTVQPSVFNDGRIELGYTDNNFDFTFPNILTLAGEYDSNPWAQIQLALRNPTRLAGGVFDTLVFSDDAQLAGTLNVNFLGDNNNLPYPWAPFDALTIADGDTFKLFDFQADVTGVFDTLNLPFLDFPYEWRTDRLYTHGEIYVGTIPEPTVIALVAPATLLLTRRRR